MILLFIAPSLVLLLAMVTILPLLVLATWRGAEADHCPDPKGGWDTLLSELAEPTRPTPPQGPKSKRTRRTRAPALCVKRLVRQMMRGLAQERRRAHTSAHGSALIHVKRCLTPPHPGAHMG